MNIVFWIFVFILAFFLWYYLSSRFYSIGKDFIDAINNIKNNIKETEKEKEDEQK